MKVNMADMNEFMRSQKTYDERSESRRSIKNIILLSKRSTVTIFTISLTAVILLFHPAFVSAQTGELTGKVVDARTGQAISDVELHIDQTDQNTSTDSDGRFLIRNLPVGEYQLRALSMGFQSKTDSIVVESGETVEHRVELIRSFDEGDPIFVQKYRYDQSRAINRQNRRGQFNKVISSGQIDRFADYSVQDAMKRIPGIQASRSGEINLRGVGIDQFYVMMDGQRVAGTGPGDRSVDLSSISSDMVRELEVINVLRPDMYADGLAGAVNMITRRTAGGERELSLRIGGGTNTAYNSQTGLSNQFSLRYNEPLLDDKLTLVVDVSRQFEQSAWESLGVDYDVEDFGDGPVDVLERVTPGLQTDSRERLGGRLQLTFEPDNKSRYYFRGMLNSENQERVGHTNSWIANESWENPSQTGPQGIFNYQLGLNDRSTKNYTVQAGGKNLFSFLELEYRAGWSYGELYSTNYRLPFNMMGVEHTINMENRKRPVMEMMDESFNESDMILQPMDKVLDNHINNQFSGRVDATIPYEFGSLQIGSSALLNVKDAFDDGAYREYLYNFRGFLSLSGFELDDQSIDLFSDRYPMPWQIESNGAQSFFETNIPNFQLDEELFRRQSDIWNYKASENIYSGYGMGTAEFGNLTLLAGIRVEYTDAEYYGRVVEFNQFDRYQETIDTSEVSSRTDLFPNVQLQYQPGETSQFQLAYSKSMKRQTYNSLAPFQLINASDTTVFRGNPDLEPVFSHNIDLQYQQSIMSVGVISANVFYKEQQNFLEVQERQIEVEPGEIQMFDDLFNEETDVIEGRETQYQNGEDTATFYGVELSWQQYLNFIPSKLGNVGAYVNYTWTQSDFDTERDDNVDFPRQSPHVVNLAVDYTKGRFSSQLAYHWTATALRSLQQNRSLAPSLNDAEEIYRDEYEEGWKDLSLSVRFRISENFRFWVDAYNLIGQERIRYEESQNAYPVQMLLQDGAEFRLGIRFDL